MKKILLEKLLVYTSLFILLFMISSNEGTIAANTEQEFLDSVAKTMQTYNYTQTDGITCDLKYVQEDNSVTYNYNTSLNEVKIKYISAEINLNYSSDLNNIYSFLSKLYNDDISIYSSEIQKMINDYTTTGQSQIFHDLNNERQLTLEITSTTSIGKDYQLYYSITAFNR